MQPATQPVTVPIPAATLILFDESRPGPARHLMLGRSAAMAFAPRNMVFPGGRVEPEDHALAASPLILGAPEDTDDAAARVAAIRETLEETGISSAMAPLPAPETIPAWRAALKSGTPFAQLLQQAGTRLDLSRLIPFARWIPKLNLTRRFDARFYVALHEGSLAATHDQDEATHHAWLTAQEALREKLMFPTARNLERLAAHPSFAQTLAHLREFPCPLVTPELRLIGDEKHICIAPGLGYEITQAPAGPEIVRDSL